MSFAALLVSMVATQDGGMAVIYGHAGSEKLFDGVEVLGPLDPDLARQSIRRQSRALGSCWPDAGTRRLEVKVVLTATGSVAKVELTQLSGDTGVDACILERVRTWRFAKPSPAGTSVVRFPLQN